MAAVLNLPVGRPCEHLFNLPAKQFVGQLIERLGSVYIHGSGDEWSAALEAALTTTPQA
jgi:hypothetical protein